MDREADNKFQQKISAREKYWWLERYLPIFGKNRPWRHILVLMDKIYPRSISCHYYGLKCPNFIGNRYLKTEFQSRSRAKFNLKSFSLFQKSTSGHEFRENLNRGAEMLSMDWRDFPNSARVILFGKKWNGWRIFRNSNPPRELSPQTNLELNSQQNSRALPVSWIIILSSAVVTSLILNK